MVTISGGDLMEAHLAEISKNAQNAAEVQVGFLSDATYDDGTPVAMVAAIQEFGAPRAGIPPRPFFRNMIAEKSDSWPKAIGDLLVKNNYDAHKTLAIAGMAIENQLQSSIVALMTPALSPTTIMLRKMRQEDPDLVVTGKTVGEAAARVARGDDAGGVSTKPLVDTGVMLHSVSSVVK